MNSTKYKFAYSVWRKLAEIVKSRDGKILMTLTPRIEMLTDAKLKEVCELCVFSEMSLCSGKKRNSRLRYLMNRVGNEPSENEHCCERAEHYEHMSEQRPSPARERRAKALLRSPSAERRIGLLGSLVIAHPNSP